MKITDQAKAARKFYILSTLLLCLVMLNAGCSLFDCTGCVMAGVILAVIFYVLVGWIPYIGWLLVILALYLFAQQPAAKKIINESCCSVSTVSAEARIAPDK